MGRLGVPEFRLTCGVTTLDKGLVINYGEGGQKMGKLRV